MNYAEEISKIIYKKKDIFIKVSHDIWNNPELYFKEYKSSKFIMDVLKEEGFETQEGVNGMPTAFISTYGSGKPVIGLLAEFDALPMLSQEALKDTKCPIIENGAGHGCGHNLLGAGVLAGAVGAKEFMDKNGIKGTLKFFGCPAEEAGWSKMFLARDGYFNDLDGAYTWHPSNVNSVQGSSSLANICVYFNFTGKSAHAAGAPHLGRSALDSCEIMNVGVNYLREHIIPEARVHYAYQDVGGPAPNIVQQTSSLKYFIRAPKIKQVLEIAERVQNIARGSALINDTEVEIKLTAGMCDFVPNDTLSNLLSQCLYEVGATVFDDKDRKLAQKFFKTFTDNEISVGIKRVSDSYDNPEQYRNVALIEDLAPYRRVVSTYGFGSTDVGDVSYATPTAQLNIACYANGSPAHSWQVTAQSKSSISDNGLITAGKVLALAVIKSMESQELLKLARDEYMKTTGGKYICPVGNDAIPEL